MLLNISLQQTNTTFGRTMKVCILYLISVVDAIGKPDSGILGGNFRWLGSFDECVDVRAAINKSGAITYPWKGQYCTAHIGLKHVGKVKLCCSKLKAYRCVLSNV